MTKGLIDLHGGEVEARSQGAGAGVGDLLAVAAGVHAPFEAAEELAEPQEADAAAQAGARKILVVEDNPDAGAMLCEFLELSGHQVELADSGAAGVRAARAFHPEFVLCDIGLPGMNGFEVAAELRRDPATSSARLIAVTGYGREEDRRRSKEAGFDLHLTKPVDPAKLQALLREE